MPRYSERCSLETYELFIPQISHLVVSDHGRLRELKPQKAKLWVTEGGGAVTALTSPTEEAGEVILITFIVSTTNIRTTCMGLLLQGDVTRWQRSESWTRGLSRCPLKFHSDGLALRSKEDGHAVCPICSPLSPWELARTSSAFISIPHF